MTQSATSAQRWRISTRARGEVLTAEARFEGCQFLVVGLPPSPPRPEIESWLGDLLGVAGESASKDLNARPIPSLLHHALTGLLFSHREVWNAIPPVPTLSLVFVHLGDDAAFGWVGSAVPRIWIDGKPAEPKWIRVRDHGGREASALSVKGSSLQVAFDWAASSGPDAARAQIKAEWGASAESGSDEAEREEAVEPPAAQAEAAEQLAAAVIEPQAAEEVIAEDIEPDAAPFTIAEMWNPVPTGPESIAAPLKEGKQKASGRSVSGPEVAATPGGPRIPELIPPTPEPADLTANAIEAEGIDATAKQGAGSAKAEQERKAREGAADHGRWAEDQLLRRRASLRATSPKAEHARGGSAAEPARGASAVTPAREAAPAAKPASTGPADELASELAPALAPASAPARPRRRMHPAWPTEREIERSRRSGLPPWLRWAALVLAVGFVAWLMGLRGSSVPAMFGLGGARFNVKVESRPPGAWVAVDGKDLAVRTPSTIELKAGEHEVTLSFPELGSAAFTVRGNRGERQSLSAPLWGTLAVSDGDSRVTIAVELDGERVGYAPLTVDSLAPGAHELRFSGPGLTPWGQALRVRVGEITEVIARPMTTPASGVLEVRAVFTDSDGTNELEGATVWIDGDRRGTTPLVIELPRGPHSARVEFRGEGAPIQVIDLPGGNQRFATFELGTNVDAPALEPGPMPATVSRSRPTVVSVNLDGVGTTDVREMWLHVREPDGVWRRYQMVMLKSPSGVVGVALFPTTLFDARGATRYYMSATTPTGDEYFTDIQTARSTARQSAPAPIPAP